MDRHYGAGRPCRQAGVRLPRVHQRARLDVPAGRGAHQFNPNECTQRVPAARGRAGRFPGNKGTVQGRRPRAAPVAVYGRRVFPVL